MQFLLATTNKAKIKYYGTGLLEQGIDILTLRDLNIDLEVEENGKNPIDNAILKAKAYYEASKLPTIAIDEGLFFENVPEEVQPGVYVRRVNGKRLEDNEMVSYYKNLVKEYGNSGQLKGYFLKSVAIVYEDSVYTFDYQAKRIFSSESSSIVEEGYPLESIQLIPSFHKFKSELSEEERLKIMNEDQKDIFDFILNTIITIEKNSKIFIK